MALFLRQKLDEAQFVAAPIDETVIDLIDEVADDIQAQSAPPVFAQIIFERNAFALIDGKVDGGIIGDDDFDAVAKGGDQHVDFEAQRLRVIRVLDDVGAGFADRHFDFGDLFIVEAHARRATDDGLADLRQRFGRSGQRKLDARARTVRNLADVRKRRSLRKAAGFARRRKFFALHDGHRSPRPREYSRPLSDQDSALNRASASSSVE